MVNMVLVDKKDNKIGLMEKMETHRKGLLHRAFSGFIFNSKGELLIQRRALCKYHNAGIWANTVCSHPFDGESVKDGVERRVFEELGFYCKFNKIGEFVYKISFKNGLTENEYDHVLIGYYDGIVKPVSTEVMDYKWISLEDLQVDIKKTPEKYTYWIKKILELRILYKEI